MSISEQGNRSSADARDLPDDEVPTQILGVSYDRPATGRERLIYAPVPLDRGQTLQLPAAVPVREAMLRHDLEQVRAAVEALARQQTRKASGFEAVAAALARTVIPEGGFVGMLEAGVHPQFDIISDAAAAIPWEVLEEFYFACPHCPTHLPPPAPREVLDPYCPACGTRMRRTGGKLALAYHLTHLVRSGGWPAAEGHRFLVVQDPTGDLCAAPNDRGEICARHLDEIRALLKQRGYQVMPLSGENATVTHVLESLADETVVGVYYFGHGFSPRGNQDGRLVLHDGFLYAEQIERVRPGARFVFINACEGAAARRDWEFEKRSSSIAEAFARGGRGRVVVAPLWPILSTQAAEAALEFFRCADGQRRLGHALMQVRRASLARYDAGEAHMAWMAYRYFGDPNKTLPAPVIAPRGAGLRGGVGRAGSVFLNDGKLQTEAFAFVIDEVLVRAARHRNLQHRPQVTVRDFLAGLIYKGDLTRYGLSQCGVNDVDGFYKFISEQLDIQSIPLTREQDSEQAAMANELVPLGDQDQTDELGRKAALSKWLVRDRQQFAPELVALLEGAGARALADRRTTDPRISEQDVLLCLLADLEWLRLVPFGLPSADRMRRVIEARHRARLIDENGAIQLDGLGSNARAVIETAQVLAQQRGVFPINDRLMFAALLANPHGFAARVCRLAGVQREALFATLVGAHKQSRPMAFGLSLEACAQIVSPVLACARRLAAGHRAVTERDLLLAFCDRADPEFKLLLRGPEFGIDLDQLKQLDPDARLDADAIRVLATAQAMADKLQLQRLPNRLLLAAFLIHPQGHAARLLQRHHIPDDLVCAQLISAVSGKFEQQIAAVAALPPPERDFHLEAAEGVTKEMIARAEQLRGDAPLITEALLFRAFCEVTTPQLKESLKRLKWPLDLGALNAADAPSGGQLSGAPRLGAGEAAPQAGAGNRLLETFGKDLTQKAARRELPAIVGREDEIETALQTLLLTENASPLLIGEAGVGKTAIVEGLARRINEGRCPDKLRAMRLVEISAGALVANTRFRGEFEQRMQEILAEARAGVILFIDEIHTIVGAGAGDGAGPDAGNMLKAALARGELRLIGATTHAEFKRTIARDPALARRFQAQMIHPPSREATVQVLASRQKTLEAHHGVRITKNARLAAVDLSGRFILDQQWPAKARDVLERACVWAITKRKHRPGRAAVTSAHVARVVAQQTGIPLERVSLSEMGALASLDARLGKRIVGQQAAIQTVADAIRRGRQGLAGADKPWGVFLFAGPPGTGKTELAKALADEVYGASDGLIRFDMGDFTEPHAVARLIGAPRGYVGYEQGAPLLERLRRRPYSLLLFDEIDHAHPDALAVLLRLFSEGTIADSDGQLADARNAIIILTTNLLGADPDARRPGFTTAALAPDSTATGLRLLLERQLPGKFIDRLDAIVKFTPLTVDDLEAIARRAIAALIARASALHKVALDVDASVARWIAVKAAGESLGARAVHRRVDCDLAGPLGDCLNRASKNAQSIRVVIAEDAIRVEAAGG